MSDEATKNQPLDENWATKNTRIKYYERAKMTIESISKMQPSATSALLKESFANGQMEASVLQDQGTNVNLISMPTVHDIRENFP